MPAMLDDHEPPGAGEAGAASVGADVTARTILGYVLTVRRALRELYAPTLAAHDAREDAVRTLSEAARHLVRYLEAVEAGRPT